MSHNILFLNYRGFNKNQRGASLIEFAFVFPILITIILTTLELGIMLAIKVNMQSCVMAGAYYGAAGNHFSGATRSASAQTIMTNGISGLLNISNVTITMESYPSFAIASLGGSGTLGTGNPGEVGKYKMQYAYTPVNPLVVAIFGSPKILSAITYAVNEEIFPP